MKYHFAISRGLYYNALKFKFKMGPEPIFVRLKRTRLNLIIYLRRRRAAEWRFI